MLDALFDLALELVDELAHRGALFVGDIAHPAHDLGQLARASEDAHADRLDLVIGGGVGELGSSRDF